MSSRTQYISLSTCYLECGSHLARLHRRRRRRRRRRAYVPTSNTASHDNHEKINSRVSFCFPHTGCLWGSAWRPFGPPELRYKIRSREHYSFAYPKSIRITSVILVECLQEFKISEFLFRSD